jgi:hypothetical protein
MRKSAMFGFCLVLGACSANGTGEGTAHRLGSAPDEDSARGHPPVGHDPPKTGGQGGTDVPLGTGGQIGTGGTGPALVAKLELVGS